MSFANRFFIDNCCDEVGDKVQVDASATQSKQLENGRVIHRGDSDGDASALIYFVQIESDDADGDYFKCADEDVKQQIMGRALKVQRDKFSVRAYKLKFIFELMK